MAQKHLHNKPNYINTTLIIGRDPVIHEELRGGGIFVQEDVVGRL